MNNMDNRTYNIISENNEFVKFKRNKIDTKSISDKIYDILIESFIHGQLKFGETLNIKQIANNLGVSSMPVRDAINRLANENIVQINPRRNCRLIIPKKKYILELFEIRKALEIFALKKYLTSSKQKRLYKLNKLIQGMKAIRYRSGEDKNSLNGYRALINLDTLYHREFVCLAENKEMLEIYKNISLQLNMAITYSICDFPYEKRILEDHQMIYDYLISGSNKAIVILKKHLEYIREKIIRSKKLISS